MDRSTDINELAAALASLGGGYWTSLHDAPGYYVSADGRIASDRQGRVRVLAGRLCGKYLAFYQKGRPARYVHHVVCEVFRGPRPDGAQVRHLDGNRFNNAADNLVWGTPSENYRDRLRHGTDHRGAKGPKAKLTNELVAAMRSVRAEQGWSYARIGRAFGVSMVTAFNAITGRTYTEGR